MPPSTAVPDFGYQARSSRVFWKWSIGITAVVLLFYAWQCGSAMMLGRSSADQLVRRFHQELNGARFDQISREADEGFGHDETLKLLAAVHTKLGDAGAQSLENMNINAGTDGTYVTTQFSTQFARGLATETFTWIKKSGELKLYAYNIESDAFLRN